MTTNLQSRVLNLNYGPHNAATLGPLKLSVLADCETVVEASVATGFLHRGLEKIAERVAWNGYSPFTDRVDYLASIHCNLAYAMAVEKLAGIEVSVRAQYIRVITSELNRIASHLFSMGHLAGLVGGETMAMFLLRDRERINNLFEMLCGARLTYNYVRVGGVVYDITEGFIEKTYEVLNYFTPKLQEYENLLTKNQVFVGRLSGVGVIPQGRAVAAGVSGPNLRATGSNWDLRKTMSYCGYETFKFEVPTGASEFGGVAGDCFARFCVRMREIKESFSIVNQALDRLPSGEFQTADTKNPKLTVKEGEAYAAVEGPRGIFGVYVRSLGGKKPDRLKFRTPSVSTLTLVPEVVAGAQVGDVPTILGSLDVMVSEVDR